MSGPRRIPRLCAALAVCGVLVLSACSGSSNGRDFTFTSKNERGTLISEGKRKPAQGISGELINSGKRVTLAANKGHVTVLNFFASWCSPCKVETPQLDSLYRQMEPRGLRFIGFDTHDDKGAGRSFISSNDITFPVVFDQEGAVQLKLGNIPGVLPFTVLVDKEGRVAAVYLTKLTPKDLQGPVDTLLAER